MISLVLRYFTSNDKNSDIKLESAQRGLSVIANGNLLSELSTAELGKWTGRINALLNSRHVESKLTAVKMIDVSLSQISKCCLPYMSVWCSSAVSMLTKTDVDRKILLKTIISIFQSTQSNADLWREVTAMHLPKVCQAILSMPNTSMLEWPQLVELAVLAPTLMKPFVEKIHKKCIDQVYKNGGAVEAIGSLMAELCNCEGKSMQNTTACKLFNRSIATVHNHLDHLFRTIDEVTFTKSDYEPFPTADVDADYLIGHVAHLDYCLPSLRLLDTFIKHKFNFVVSLPCEDLFELLRRIFNLHSSFTSRMDVDAQEADFVRGFTARIHMDANLLLQSLVQVLGTRAVRYRNRLVYFVLRQTSTYSSGTETMVASTISLITVMVRLMGREIMPIIGEAICEFLKPHMVLVVAGKETVISMEHEENTRRKKRAKYQASSTVVKDIKIDHSLKLTLASMEAYSEIACLSATINPQFKNTIDQICIKALIAFYAGTSSSKDPVHDPQIRLLSLQCLLQSLLTSAFVQSTILPLVVPCFTNGLSDSSPLVKKYCRQSLTYIDLLLRPRVTPIVKRSVLIAAEKSSDDVFSFSDKEDEIDEDGDESIKQEVDADISSVVNEKIPEVVEVITENVTTLVTEKMSEVIERSAHLTSEIATVITEKAVEETCEETQSMEVDLSELGDFELVDSVPDQ